MAKSEAMKQRFAEDGPGPRPTERNDMQRWLALLGGLGFAVAIFAAALAGAQEAERVAQAGDPEPPVAASSPPAEPDPDEPDPAAEPKPRVGREIEEYRMLDAPGGVQTSTQRSFQVSIAGDAEAAARLAVDIFDAVYDLPADSPLVVEEV